jgi:hypothetical protein
MTTPHPEHEIARRLVQLERDPDVTIWDPRTSVSGDWEAMVGDDLFQADNPSALCDRIDVKLKARQ